MTSNHALSNACTSVVTHLCVALARWWARRRRVLVVATVRRLGALKLDAILLAVVTLVRAVTVVAVVIVGSSRIGWRGRAVVVVVVVGLRVVAADGSGGPACAVEGCTAGLSPTTRGDAAAWY